MKNKVYYNWKVIYPNGEIYYNKGIKLKELKSPFRFELVPLVNHLKKYYIDIKIGEQLIYFRRVKGHLKFIGENEIDWIRYYIGKKINDYTSVLLIDAETGKLQIQSGKDLKL